MSTIGDTSALTQWWRGPRRACSYSSGVVGRARSDRRAGGAYGGAYGGAWGGVPAGMTGGPVGGGAFGGIVTPSTLPEGDGRLFG